MKSSPNKPSKTPPDKSVNIRCPRLGHQIGFSYCQTENSGFPCFKALDCWHHYFDVHTFLKENLTVQDFNTIFLHTGQPKIISLIELIEQAKKNQEAKD
jgi:hypothetical protein